MSKNKPLIVIAGPTASGKTSLAIDLAKKYGGEIICADSRSVYKGMDIGTAKVTKIEMQGVPHWGLDLVEPGSYFTVFDFKKYALGKIAEIRSRGNVPFLVGGTGLYIDSIIFDYQFSKEANVDKRTTLNNMTIDQLQRHCLESNVALPENKNNKRYLVRAIEKNGVESSKNQNPVKNTIIVGLTTSKDKLKAKIEARFEQMIENGVVDEAILLGKNYGWDNEALKSNIYRVVKLYEKGLINLDEIKIKLLTLDWRLAKRQMTWLRRNKFINWLSIDEAKEYISSRLAKLD